MPRNVDPYESVEYLRAKDPGLRLVIERLRANYDSNVEPRTQEELGALLYPPISKQAVNRWRRVPDIHCSRVAELLGCKVHELRPDVFPTPVSRRPKPSDRELTPV